MLRSIFDGGLLAQLRLNDHSLQQLTVFAARLYHRCLQVRLENLPEARTEAEGRDQTRHH